MLYRSQEYPINKLLEYGVLPAGRGKRARSYINAITAFDIETSRITVDNDDQSIMYVWQWAIENDVIMGRTWEQFSDFVRRVNEVCNINNCHLVVYVHNLSYEFSYLKGVYKFSEDDVFIVDKRRPLKCNMMNIEFRCSFIHSGLSLKTWLNEVKAPHRKLSGKQYNYNITRYPWTPLTYREIKYCINDVRGVVDAIHIEMNRDGDNIASIPLTKTGYVRRVIKKAIKNNIDYSIMRDIQPDYDIYIALREAFRGGDTHASRFYSGRILENVKHVDRSSSYPDVMCNCEFPMSKFKKVDNPTIEDVIACMKHRKAVLMRLRLLNVELKSLWRFGCPYIAYDRCRYVSQDYTIDNGRILTASYLEITITDIDFNIILDQYNAEIQVLDMWSSRYAMLPDSVRNEIKQLYTTKTSLKGVKGQELIYALSKSMINACYGMTAQDPGKPDIIYKADDDRQFIYNVERDRRDILKESAKKNFLPYQIGVWVTALARSELHAGISLIDNCKRIKNKPIASFVYCDTDSIFYLGDIDWENDYNAIRQKRSIKNGAYAKDRKDKSHYMGVMEYEDTCKRFACMGAKKYAYEDEYGTLHITIAGVAKDIGAIELQSMGGLEKFVDIDKPPLFIKAGGTEIKYNDMINIETVIDGHKLKITDNAVIRESTYQLGITDKYRELLDRIENNIDLIDYMGDMC